LRIKLILCFSFIAAACQVFGQDQGKLPLAALLDDLAAPYYEEQLQAAFGTFTFEYTELATPFSRWFEDELILAVPSARRVRLFNRSAAAAMDPAFRDFYAGFFDSNRVDALISGRYFEERNKIRVRLDLTSLRDGNLIGSGEIYFEKKAIPVSVTIAPDMKAAATAETLSKMLGEATGTTTMEQSGLVVSLMTERGAGGAYRDGERLTVMATVTEDAYLKLYHVDVNGKVKLIWPNRYSGGNGRLEAGLTVTVPSADDPFEFILGRPYGTEFIKAIASTVAFTEKEGDFQELEGDARSAITRGLSFGLKGSDRNTERRAEAIASYVILVK